jgi:hypothetical protein
LPEWWGRPNPFTDRDPAVVGAFEQGAFLQSAERFFQIFLEMFWREACVFIQKGVEGLFLPQ